MSGSEQLKSDGQSSSPFLVHSGVCVRQRSSGCVYGDQSGDGTDLVDQVGSGRPEQGQCPRQQRAERGPDREVAQVSLVPAGW